jgi:hypothetical protein
MCDFIDCENCENCEGDGWDIYNNSEDYICTVSNSIVGRIVSDGYENFTNWYDIKNCPIQKK